MNYLNELAMFGRESMFGRETFAEGMNRMYVNILSEKQERQVRRLCREFQPYTRHDRAAFISLVDAAELFCTWNIYPYPDEPLKRFQLRFVDNWTLIRGKYYPDGVKSHKDNHFEGIEACKHVTFALKKVRNEAHKAAFMRVVRACRDFLREGGKKEAETALYQRLLVCRGMYTNKDI